jgi:hypothetical protein
LYLVLAVVATRLLAAVGDVGVVFRFVSHQIFIIRHNMVFYPYCQCLGIF